MKKRPIAVTFLAILAGLVAALAAVHTLQSLGLLPYFIGKYTVSATNIWSAMMWALLVWIWVWVVRMLWRMDKQGWLFLVVISVFNLIIDFTVMLGVSGMTDVGVNFLINALVLIICMLPGVKDAFDV